MFHIPEALVENIGQNYLFRFFFCLRNTSCVTVKLLRKEINVKDRKYFPFELASDEHEIN